MKGARLAARLLPVPCNSGISSVACNSQILGRNVARILSPDYVSSAQATSAAQLSFARGMAANNKVTIEYIKLTEPETDDYKHKDPTNFAQLLSSLRCSSNLDRTSYLLDKFSAQFDTVHYVMAIMRVAKLAHVRGKDIVARDGVAWSEVTKPYWQRPNALPHPRLVEKAKALLARLEEEFPPHLNNIYPRQAANLLWSYGQLKRRGVVEACPFLGDFLLTISHDNFRAMELHANGADYAQIVKGLANLHAAGAATDARTRAQIEAFVDSLTDEMLVRRGHIRKLDAREAQTVLWGYGRIFGKNAPGAADRRAAAKDSATEAVAKREKTVNLLCDALLSAGVNSLAPTSYAGAFWALAELEHASHKDLMSAMAGGYSLQTTLLSPQDVNLTVSGCAALGFRDENLLHICAAKASGMLNDFTSKGLAYVMAAFGSLRYDHDGFFGAVNKSILEEPVVEISPDLAWRVLSAYAGAGRKDAESLKVCGRVAEAAVKEIGAASEGTCARFLAEVDKLGLAEAGLVKKEQLEAVQERRTWLQGQETSPSV